MFVCVPCVHRLLLTSCVCSWCVLSGGVFVRSCFLFVFLPGVIDKQGGAVCVAFPYRWLFCFRVLCFSCFPRPVSFSLPAGFQEQIGGELCFFDRCRFHHRLVLSKSAVFFFLDRVLFSLTGGARLAIRPVNALRAARGD